MIGGRLTAQRILNLKAITVFSERNITNAELINVLVKTVRKLEWSLMQTCRRYRNPLSASHTGHGGAKHSPANILHRDAPVQPHLCGKGLSQTFDS